LHVAAEIGRPEAGELISACGEADFPVELLLNDPRIDDTIKDDRGRSPLECASNSEVAGLIEGKFLRHTNCKRARLTADSRAALQVRYMSLLAAYVASPLSSAEEANNIVKFLDQPRAENVNLNALDDRTGTSLLHEAARRRDLRLVEMAVKRGADVFVRDRRGRRALEGDKGADERIRAYLKQCRLPDRLSV
jgi:ankyrin repeat protein